MSNQAKAQLLSHLQDLLGPLKRLPSSQSLMESLNGIRLYLRYSRIHNNKGAFYGLRQVDLNMLEGHPSYICFYSEEPTSTVVLPYSDFEQVIRQSPLASDGQFKVKIYEAPDSRELYLPRVGLFNVDSYGGLGILERISDPQRNKRLSSLGHCNVQTLLGGIGHMRGFSIYIPPGDAIQLDWNLVPKFTPLTCLPKQIMGHAAFAAEIDVLWLDHKEQAISAAFEVEHSTSIYSGLLRFNDVLLTCRTGNRFFIVADEGRRDVFARQLQRPTFQRSGLSELTSFLDYSNALDWYDRLANSSSIS